VTELVCKTFEHSLPVDVDILPFLSLLNSASIEKAARILIWNLLKSRPPSISAFSRVFARKDDQVELVDFLLVTAEPQAKNLLLEAAQTNIVAFARGYEFLERVAESEMCEQTFANSVLTLDIGEQSAVVVLYLRKLFERMERARIVRPMVERIKTGIDFLNDLLADVEVVIGEDVRPLFGGLTVVKELGLRKEAGEQELAALKTKLDAEEIRNLIPELGQLWELLKDIISG
jgi:hypothetical protein